MHCFLSSKLPTFGPISNLGVRSSCILVLCLKSGSWTQNQYSYIKNKLYNVITLLHFWVASFCYNLDDNRRLRFPRGVIAISDILTIFEDVGNQIPDKSWMLYLLEIFSTEDIPAELNLICQFDNQNYFEAIFSGVNRYRFKRVLPIIGHSYLRQIIMNSLKQYIIYILEDRNTKQIERFELLLDSGFIFQAQRHFTGIEWWNRINNFPYPIRLHLV